MFFPPLRCPESKAMIVDAGANQQSSSLCGPSVCEKRLGWKRTSGSPKSYRSPGKARLKMLASKEQLKEQLEGLAG
jgi:hypothetical protein